MHRIRILVPVSFSEQSANVLVQARTLAGKMDGMLTCLHVIEKLSFGKGKLTIETEKKIRREAEIRLSEKVNLAIPGEDKIPFEIIVTAGRPFKKILEKADELHTDLIVMGILELSEPENPQLGPNAARVLTASSVPVLTIFPDGLGSDRHIFLPLDMSDDIKRKISGLMEIAEMVNAKVTVCTFLRKGDQKYRAACEEKLRAVSGIFAEQKIECSTFCLEAWKPVTLEVLDLAFAGRIAAPILIAPTEAGQ